MKVIEKDDTVVIIASESSAYSIETDHSSIISTENTTSNTFVIESGSNDITYELELKDDAVVLVDSENKIDVLESTNTNIISDRERYVDTFEHSFFSGPPGKIGPSVYDLAIKEGAFDGTIDEWLEMITQKSAYGVALNEGFVGTKQEWLESLHGLSAYQVALDAGFVGTREEWLESLKVDIPVYVEDTDKILTNDGTDTYWMTLEDRLNQDQIQWDLGEFT